MKLSYVLKASAGDTARHLVLIGRWKLGELMIRPGGVTFHPSADPRAVYPFPTREAFEAALGEDAP